MTNPPSRRNHNDDNDSAASGCSSGQSEKTTREPRHRERKRCTPSVRGAAQSGQQRERKRRNQVFGAHQEMHQTVVDRSHAGRIEVSFGSRRYSRHDQQQQHRGTETRNPKSKIRNMKQERNPKHEIRNLKQIRMTNSNGLLESGLKRLGCSNFEFVSDFDIRISDLPSCSIFVLQISDFSYETARQKNTTPPRQTIAPATRSNLWPHVHR